MKRVLNLGVAAMVLTSPALAAGNAANDAQAMRELNLILLGNMQAQNGEVEGKAIVGGAVTGNSFQVGFGSSANTSQGSAQSARPTWTAGNQPININVRNSSNGGQGLVGAFGTTSVYGAAVQGNAQSFNLNA
jgi:choice-of-anchor A domain-containing protein